MPFTINSKPKAKFILKITKKEEKNKVKGGERVTFPSAPKNESESFRKNIILLAVVFAS
jgi:hypothetical protein